MSLRELEYPFDAERIITGKKKIKKELLAQGSSFVDKKIAILGGSTTSGIKLIIELFLLDQGIRPAFYESEYNRFYQDAVFENSELDDFAPDIIYIHTSNRNITEYPSLSDSSERVDELLRAEEDKFTSVWTSLKKKYGCPIIQNNFEMPYFRLLGNKDAYDIHGRVSFLTRLNERFYEYARSNENFYICDLNYISADYGLKEWSDPYYWHMYKYAVSVPAIPYLAFNVSNIIKSLLGKNKKGFVLDLDNTLWGGVIGDDGVENIVLGPEESEGQAYLEFQKYLKAHQQLGVILNIDSKNDYDKALSGINHPDSVFKEDDFISIKANWEPKDMNFRAIAQEINLLPESLVFIDDNPAERHIVREQIPGVRAPEITDVAHYAGIIDRSGFFEATNISKDDLRRNDMYRENAARVKLESAFSDYGEYLESLEMKGEARNFSPVYMARIAQLTNKSNQFNLTTKRYTQSDIEAAAQDPDRITLYGKLEDRFGDNGVVSVVIGDIKESECHIDLWLMSCRVLKRDMEHAMLDALAHRCIKAGVKTIFGYYYPTAKNHMVEDFYAVMGFEKVSCDDEGNTVWKLDISGGYTDKNKYISMEED